MKFFGASFLFIVFFFELLFAQSTYFNKRYDITNENWDTSTCIVNLGYKYFILNNSGPTCHVDLCKLNGTGDIEWVKNYNQSDFIYIGGAGSLFKTLDNNYVYCGTRVIAPNISGNLVKFDSLGNKVWEKYNYYYLANGFNSGNNTNDSGYILTGQLKVNNYEYLLLKANRDGNIEWLKYFLTNQNYNFKGKSVIQTPDNGYCLGGYGLNTTSGIYHGVVEIYKTTNSGLQSWKKAYGNTHYRNSGGMLCLSKDSCIIFTYGYTNQFILNENYNQLYVTKLSLSGAVIWNKKIGAVQPGNEITWIQTLSDGSYIMCGNHQVNDTLGKSVGFLFKLNSNGDSLWYKEYTILQGPHELNRLSQVTPMPDKGFAGAGTLYPYESGGRQNVWVFKTDSLGCLFPDCSVGIIEFNPGADAQLFIYPNPFKYSFAINYTIPKESKKGIFELRDVMGNVVYSTPLSLNVNQLQVVASSLKAGLYLATFIVDGAMVCIKKIIKE